MAFYRIIEMIIMAFTCQWNTEEHAPYFFDNQYRFYKFPFPILFTSDIDA